MGWSFPLMAAPVQNASAFLALVAKSGLMEEAALAAEFNGDVPVQPAQAADFLVKKGVLTGFQAKALLAGKHKGLVLGPYKIQSEIGRGGMGIVYLAIHQKLECHRAIKVLPKESTTDSLALDRFYREARAVAALDHPNIVKAYDVNEHDGVHYFVMEYVQGVNLQTHLQKKGPIPWKSAVGFIAQACRGLQHAHEREMVHRDIKPGNMLVDGKGTLKILDLGLARCFKNDNDNLTGKYASAQDEFMGSVDFMAPEVALGDQAIDIRTDIYSLGVTLYALIVGRPPFDGSPAQKLMQHQMKPVPPVHELRPEVPEMLSAVIARMTQKVVTQRYPTPAAVLDALAPWLGNVASTRSPAPLPRAAMVSAATQPQPTARIERQANRDTRPIRADAQDTQTNRPPEDDADDRGHTGRRKKKRFKKKRSRGANVGLLIAVPIIVVVVGAGIWGALTLYDYVNDKPASPQVASANTRATPPRRPEPSRSQPGTPPNRSAPTPTPPSTPPKNPGVIPPSTPPQTPGPETEPPPPEGLEVGLSAPDIAGEDLDGVEFLLSDYRGKVVLLDFFGFW
jgi:serine/threonine protein kinase